MLGVTEFHLYDNGSTDPWHLRIPELASSVHDFPGTGVQIEAFDNCLRHQARADWIAFIDVDEYLWNPAGGTIPQALAAVRASAVSVRWRMFGDGGHRHEAALPTIDAYLRCSPHVGGLGKMIVRRDRVKEVLNPHRIQVRGRVVDGDDVGLRLNHYWTRSEAEVQRKFLRGRATGARPRRWREYVVARDELSSHVDPELSLLHGPALRAALRREPPAARVD